MFIGLKIKQFKQYKQAITKYRAKIRAYNELLKKIGKIRIVINTTIAPKNITHIKALVIEYDILKALQKALSPTSQTEKMRIKGEYRRIQHYIKKKYQKIIIKVVKDI